MAIARLNDGLELYYEEYDFADPWRPHDTVVLHHGYGKDVRFWRAWIPILARHYRVVAFDFRGFGRSTVPPPGYPWSFAGFANDLNGLLDFLSLERVHLIGETVGGAISLYFACEHPERLKSLTVCNSPYKITARPGEGGGGLQGDDEVGPDGVAGWVRSSMASRVDPNDGDPAQALWYAQQMSKTAKSVREATGRWLPTLDLTAQIPNMKVPMLILIAEKSAMREWADGMHALIPGSKLVVVPGASGFVQHTAPERCAEEWLQFVRALA